MAEVATAWTLTSRVINITHVLSTPLATSPPCSTKSQAALLSTSWTFEVHQMEAPVHQRLALQMLLQVHQSTQPVHQSLAPQMLLHVH